MILEMRWCVETGENIPNFDFETFLSNQNVYHLNSYNKWKAKVIIRVQCQKIINLNQYLCLTITLRDKIISKCKKVMETTEHSLKRIIPEAVLKSL